MDPELREHLDAMEHRLNDRIELIETRLLTAFHDWARPVEIRLRTLPMIEERLGLLEERVSKIERGDKPASNGSQT